VTLLKLAVVCFILRPRTGAELRLVQALDVCELLLQYLHAAAAGCLPHAAILIDIINIVSVFLHIQSFQLAQRILKPLKLAVVRLAIRLCICTKLLVVQALDLC